MKKLVALAALVAMLLLVGCAQGQASTSVDVSSKSATSTSASSTSAESTDAADVKSTTAATNDSTESVKAVESFVISTNGRQFEVQLADTNAARALAEQLQTGPITVSLHPYGGFEQVGPLPWALPENDEQITTSPGDVMLYQGNQITIFTGSNSWAYTPLGRIVDASSDALREVFGGDAIEITLSLA